MSTIAYRNGIMAADTATCVGGSLCGRFTKVVKGPSGSIAGAAGDAVYAARFLEWVSLGEVGPAPEAKEYPSSIDRGIIVRAGSPQILTVYEPGGNYNIELDYFAIGSGKSEALGAMHAGADAIGAVLAAIHLDPHTGGDIITVAIDD